MNPSHLNSYFVSGRLEEFHLQSPIEPYVNLSIHTAPSSLTLGLSKAHADAGNKTAPPSLIVGGHSLKAGSFLIAQLFDHLPPSTVYFSSDFKWNHRTKP
jgi:hypothetical protein